MIRTLIKSLKCENSEIYCVKDSRRVLFAKCETEIEVYSNSQKVLIAGNLNGGIKTYKPPHSTSRAGNPGKSSKILCSSLETTCNIDDNFFTSVSRFEITADIQRSDGVYERLQFDNIELSEVELGGDWKFDVNCSKDFLSKLLLI